MPKWLCLNPIDANQKQAAASPRTQETLPKGSPRLGKRGLRLGKDIDRSSSPLRRVELCDLGL